MRLTADADKKRKLLKPMVSMVANMHGNEVNNFIYAVFFTFSAAKAAQEAPMSVHPFYYSNFDRL